MAFNTRQKEHQRNVIDYKAGSNIAKHTWTCIDFGNAKILEMCPYRHRAVLESWYTAVTEATDNNSNNLPDRYRFLVINFKHN